jgi:hypothetical protein
MHASQTSGSEIEELIAPLAKLGEAGAKIVLCKDCGDTAQNSNRMVQM